jgi:hypothetical protein
MKRNKKITLGYGGSTPFYLYILKYWQNEREYTEGIYSDLVKAKKGICKFHPKERKKVLATEKMLALMDIGGSLEQTVSAENGLYAKKSLLNNSSKSEEIRTLLYYRRGLLSV